MKRPSVFITSRVHPQVIAFLDEFARVEANPNLEPFPRGEYLDRASRADAMMVFMNDSVDGRMLEKCPNLRIVVAAAAEGGADNFDVAACTKRGVRPTDCSGPADDSNRGVGHRFGTGAIAQGAPRRSGRALGCLWRLASGALRCRTFGPNGWNCGNGNLGQGARKTLGGVRHENTVRRSRSSLPLGKPT